MQISREQRNDWIFIGALGVLIFIGVVFGVLMFNQFQSSQPNPSPKASKEEFGLNLDRVLAIRLDQCCSCPELVTRQALLENKNLVEYQPGKNLHKRKQLIVNRLSVNPAKI